MALWATIYLSLMGKEGLKEAAQMSVNGAHYLYDKLIASGKFKPAFKQPFFNEFCVKYVGGNVDELQQRLIDNGILGGIKMADDMLMLAVTEKRTKEEVDLLVSLVTQ